MLVENIEPLLNELLHWAFALSFWLLTKHIKNKNLQFITLYWQECGREAGDGWAPAILFSKEHFSGRPAIYLLYVPSLSKESSVLVAPLSEDQKKEIVIVCDLFPVSITLSIVGSLRTAL